ncbi:MAG: hypothetical protein HZA13_02955 [Nitrospirae bacterium]|nr:hypothetical protein [Nitrospirota bacterium]
MKKALYLAFLTLFISFFFIHNAIAQEKKEEKKEFKPKFGGYIETWYLSDSSDLSATGVDSLFGVRRARISAAGSVSDLVSYKIQAAFDNSLASTTTGDPKTTGTVKLWDAAVDLNFHPLILLKAGLFKTPFTLEGLEGTPARPLILRAESINAIAGTLGANPKTRSDTAGGEGFRDVGLQIAGSYKEAIGLNYAIALVNGDGINNIDNNNKKDIVARATVAPIEGLSLGGSAFRGSAENQGALSQDEAAYGLEAEYIQKAIGLGIRAEYITAKWEHFDVSTGKPASGKDQEPNGWYLQAGYKIPPLPVLEILGRYEWYEVDKNTANSKLKTTTLGLLYNFTGKTNLRLNYLMRDPDSSSAVAAQGSAAKGDKIGNMLLLSLLVAF